MADEEIIEIVDDSELTISPAIKAVLVERCDKAKIEVVEREFVDGDKYLSVALANGREKRWVSLFNSDQIDDFISIPFEKYTFLGDYNAICSYEDGSIESIIKGIIPSGVSLLYRHLFGVSYQDIDKEIGTDKVIELSSDLGESKIVIKIASTSRVLRTLAGGVISRRGGSLSLFLSGLKVSRHDSALAMLEKISNSLFIQIDMTTGIAINLMKARRPIRSIRKQNFNKEVRALEFPRVEYDVAPVSLYWYARSAVGMPLLQFLAYYQVIEFFFHTYSQEEAKRKIRTILKDPTFRIDRDTDIGRVLATLSQKGRNFGDERSQLRATIQACIDPNDLRKYLTESDEKAKFFKDKQKGLSNRKIPIENIDADLRNDVADMIYEIRCKIVHTKGDGQEGDVDLLLPFSKEAELLQNDIELMQYIARQVLISASSPLKIG